jgi:glycosyltransferase involved in cell wall biosynthesis
MSVFPSVSVCVISYNQENYISKTLDSIFEQITDFSFEIIVSDDCSTDNTRLIIDEYFKKVKNNIIFRTIHSDFNLGYKKNFRKVLESATGKYIAICEGDDYWTNSNKLQKQFRQLEENPLCVISFHNVSVLNSVTGESNQSNNEINGSLFTMFDLIKEWNVMTSSLMFRSSALKLPVWFDTVFNTDYALQLILASSGGSLIYIDESMSVYRKHPNGVSNSIWGASSVLWLIYLFTKINEVSDNIYRKAIRKKISELEKELISSNLHLFKISQKKASYCEHFRYYLKNLFVQLGMTKIYLKGFKKVHNLK